MTEIDYHNNLISSIDSWFRNRFHDSVDWFDHEKRIGTGSVDIYVRSVGGLFYAFECKYIRRKWKSCDVYGAIGQILWYISESKRSGVLLDRAVLVCNIPPPKDFYNVVDDNRLPIDVEVI